MHYVILFTFFDVKESLLADAHIDLHVLIAQTAIIIIMIYAIDLYYVNHYIVLLWLFTIVLI